jgi:hypothetical protein
MNDWATGIFLKYQFQKLHCQCTFSSQKLELSLPHPSQVVNNYDGLLQEPNTLHLAYTAVEYFHKFCRTEEK